MADNVEKEKTPIYKKWWFWAIIIILVIGIVGSQGGDTTTQTGTNSSTSIESNTTQEKFTLVNSEGSYDGFAYYIEGTITNNTDKQYTYVQVTFNLYDADGAQIGTAMDNINNLEAKGTWKYKAIGGTENPASYKLVNIQGW